MKRLYLAVLPVASILLIVLLAAPLALGQVTATGALLQGTVKDASGGAIPSAAVTITDDATGVSEKVITDQSGRYVFNDLKPASYTMTVEMLGFKTLVRPN